MATSCWSPQAGLLALWLMGVVAGCGGKANAEGDVAAAGTGAAGTGAMGTGAAPTGGTVAEPTQPDFVPDAPPDYDEKDGLGSFEDNAGFGWDTCRTHTPENLSLQAGGSEGGSFMSFQSLDEPSQTEAPAEGSSASQVYFWPDPAAEVTDNLYLDVKNLAGTSPSGTLRFYGTDLSCGAEELLSEVDLGQLGLTPEWSARCVSGLREHQALGLAVSGGVHSIGLDAFRFGPPCHAQR